MPHRLPLHAALADVAMAVDQQGQVGLLLLLSLSLSPLLSLLLVRARV
jgi:hypothetical protein